MILLTQIAAGCNALKSGTTKSGATEISETSPLLPTSSIIPISTAYQLTPTPDLSAYAFPDAIDPAKQYLFYLHGKIIEDQGIPAISPDYGEYQYEAILEKLSGYGFVVISEQRPKDTVAEEYAGRISGQVAELLNAGVPVENITVLGASKGAAIAIYTSYLLENDELKFIIMAICHPDEVEYLVQNQIYMHGKILSIFDACDEYAGSCQEYFSLPDNRGISEQEEIILDLGLGHGILYKPMDEWITPVIQWIGES